MKMIIAIICALIAFAATGGTAKAQGCPIKNNGWCITIVPGP